jgi:ABC-type nitrate/sulfonate/bicarbonate transport system permease component
MGMIRRVMPVLTGLACLLGLLGLWQGLADRGLINTFIAPAPLDIAQSFPLLFEDEDLLASFFQSFGETLAAAAIAAGVGIPLGWWLHHNQLAGVAFENWVANLAAAPLVLLYPLFLVVFGRNAATIIAMACVTALPPIVLKTKEGLDGVRHSLINVGRSLRLSRRQMFLRILLPAAAPVIGTGLRLGMILALISVVGIEFLIHFGGMGDLIANLGDRFELAKMFAAICFVILTSVVFYFAGERVEKWLAQA